jgi:hypothetical protein
VRFSFPLFSEKMRLAPRNRNFALKQFGHPLSFSFSSLSLSSLSLLLPHTRTNRTNLQTLKVIEWLLLYPHIN